MKKNFIFLLLLILSNYNYFFAAQVQAEIKEDADQNKTINDLYELLKQLNKTLYCIKLKEYDPKFEPVSQTTNQLLNTIIKKIIWRFIYKKIDLNVLLSGNRTPLRFIAARKE